MRRTHGDPLVGARLVDVDQAPDRPNAPDRTIGVGDRAHEAKGSDVDIAERRARFVRRGCPVVPPPALERTWWIPDRTRVIAKGGASGDGASGDGASGDGASGDGAGSDGAGSDGGSRKTEARQQIDAIPRHERIIRRRRSCAKARRHDMSGEKQGASGVATRKRMRGTMAPR